MPMVKTDSLSHDYIVYEDEDSEVGTPIRALTDISLEIKEGEFVSILGHNGSGKSTLAKHLNALLLPTEGTVWIDDINTMDDSRLWDIRQRAGMVFQNPDNQIIASVVDEDVAFGPENMGVPTQQIWERVNYALEKTGMTAYRDYSPNRLSGGQKQRVAIAGVMAMQPKCIIMDEPTAMLDPVGRREVLEAVHQLNRELGITVILITHYMEEVIDSDRLYVMNKGTVVMAGTPRTLFAKVEEFQALGLDVPQITLLGYELRKAGLPLPEVILSREEMVEALCQLG
ncbi:MAG: energy-coupling factor transporter ATPase [Eubacterium sp.]|nr:energy-coupling factor transporter ATPase [Eubacterium sp.]